MSVFCVYRPIGDVSMSMINCVMNQDRSFIMALLVYKEKWSPYHSLVMDVFD